jgi:uncharacterized protein (DUF2384 family)
MHKFDKKDHLLKSLADARLQKESKRRNNAQSHLMKLATKIFEGDEKAAREWFCAEQPKLGGAKPIYHLNTD